MKKVTVFLSKELQKLVESDQEFRETNLLKNALALVVFVTETALTGIWPKVTFPVFNKWDYLNPNHDDKGYLADTLEVATRLEIHLHSGSIPGAGIQLDCESYQSGKNIEPTLCLVGFVEHSAVRCLRFQAYNPGKMVRQGRPKDFSPHDGG